MRSVFSGDWRRPYRYLAAAYISLVTIAGLTVIWLQWPIWLRYVRDRDLKWLLLAAVLMYAVLDLIRIPLPGGWRRQRRPHLHTRSLDLGRTRFAIFFPGGPVISLGFSILLIVLLTHADPAAPILVAVVGSLLGEVVHSCVGWRLGLGRVLLRAVLYAGHHALASGASAIVFVLAYAHNPVPDLGVENWPTVEVYVLVYGIVSTLVQRPYDWWVEHLIVPGETQLPRVEIASALVVLTPIAITLDCLYSVTTGNSRLVLYFLPL